MSPYFVDLSRQNYHKKRIFRRKDVYEEQGLKLFT